MKTAVIILSDPSGGDEALGRLFNGLVTAYDFKQRGDQVTVLFQGTGTRWAGHIVREDHPAHPLFKAVEDNVAGISCGCADFWDAREDAENSRIPLIDELAVPGTSGVPSLGRLVTEGYQIMTF